MAKSLRTVVFIFLLSAIASKAQQGFLSGGEITYKFAGANKFQITLTLYRDCARNSFQFLSSYGMVASTSNPNQKAVNFTVTQQGTDTYIRSCEGQLSQCEGGKYPAIVKRTYVGTIILPTKQPDWTISFQTNGRTDALTTITASSQDEFTYLEAVINNAATTVNNGVVFANQPVPYVFAKQQDTLDPGLVNPDGDEIVVSLVPSKTSSISSVAYLSGYSATNPISTNGNFSLNSSTGQMTFTPSKKDENTTFAMVVKQYSKSGTLVGSVMREMQMLVDTATSSSQPYFIGADTIRVCQGDTLNLAYVGKAKLLNTNLSIQWNNASDWNLSPPTPTPTPDSAIFSLNTIINFPQNRSINLTLYDEFCPTGKTTKNITVLVSQKEKVVFNINRADTAVICLNSFPLIANVTGGAPPYKYQWNTTSQNVNTVPVNAAGTYFVKVTDANNCVQTSNLIVYSPIFFRFFKNCVDSSVVFYDKSNQNADYNPSTNPLPATKSWLWTFEPGIQPDTNQVPSHKFPSEGDYKVTMQVSDGSGCNGTYSQTIHICGKPNADFTVVDSCSKSERSDLKVKDLVKKDSLCTVSPLGIKYYVNGQLVNGSPGGLGAVFALGIDTAGIYNIKIAVQNNAGCVDTLSKMVKVYGKPIIEKGYPNFYYKCNAHLDTSFTFSARAVNEAAVIRNSLNITIKRQGYTDSSLIVPSSTNITVPFIIPLSHTPSLVAMQTVDTLGCTNDTSFSIMDPISFAKSPISLRKYYCFVNDTLGLVDNSYIKAHDTTHYHWPIVKARWNMQDGNIDTTIGYVNHVYGTNAKSLDAAMVTLIVIDSTSCTDTTSFKVYLSEPDTSQFRLSRLFACYGDTVTVFGIKGSYINAWYFSYQPKSSSVFDSPDYAVFNPGFTQDVSNKLDTTIASLKPPYLVTQAIFYNEPDTLKDFQRYPAIPTKPITPRIQHITNVCHVTMQKSWQVARLEYTIVGNNNGYDYDHCFDDSVKKFKVQTVLTNPNILLDSSSWRWSFYQPNLQIIDSSSTLFQYTTPNTTQWVSATIRADLKGKYPPYLLKLNYQYKYMNSTLHCGDSASLEVANEKVSVFMVLPASPICVNDQDALNTKGGLFYAGPKSNPLDSNLWYYHYGNETIDTVIGTEGSYLHTFLKQGIYHVIVKAINQFGCIGYDSAAVTVKPLPKAVLSVDTVCYGFMSILDGSKSKSADTTNSHIAEYIWSYGDGTNADTTGNNKKTHKFQYAVDSTRHFPIQLIVQDLNGCTDVTQGVAVVKVQPIVDFDAFAKLTNDKDYLGNSPISFDTLQFRHVNYWRWTMGDGHVIDSTTTKNVNIDYTYPYYPPPSSIDKNKYNVTLFVRAQSGCMDSVTKQIDVNSYFVLPSAFTPNGDGLHDVWMAVGKGISEVKEFKIFNRWGEVIHSTSGKPDKDQLQRGYLIWDGKLNGELQPEGVYVYYGVLNTGYNQEIIVNGNLSIVK